MKKRHIVISISFLLFVGIATVLLLTKNSYIASVQTNVPASQNNNIALQQNAQDNLRPTAVVIADKIPSGSDYFIHDISLDKDVLLIEVSYGGGCGSHDFTLYTTGSIEKSLPPQLTLSLVHITDDGCERSIRKTLAFDLNNVKKYYMEQFSDEGPIVLKMFDYNAKQTFTVTYHLE